MKPAAIFLAAVLAVSCAGNREAGSSTASAGSTSPGPGEWFVDKAKATGLDFVHFNGMTGEFYYPENMPPGVGLLDYDNDGDLDVYFVQGQLLDSGKTFADALMRPQGPMPPRDRLFRNDLTVAPDGTRTLKFADVTSQSRIPGIGYGMGVATGDFNNDGWVDLYVTRFGPNQLLKNNGDGTFSDVSRESRTDDPSRSVSAAFVDFDRDGWLDLKVGNYLNYSLNMDQKCTSLSGSRDYCPPRIYTAQPSRIFRNLGDGTFVDETGKSQMAGQYGPALGITTADFDNDGWIDIYVANDGHENLLWMNQRNGTFKNTALVAGAGLTAEGKAEASMGVDAGDFDNDGDEDLFITEL
ncbi:MAG TPA: VCBS repeat-containing protein, partial [Vicinamibacterales bacterium]